jgi:hypothetical protein
LSGQEVNLIAEFLGNAIQSTNSGGLVVDNIGTAVEDGINTNSSLVVNSIGTSVEDDVVNNPNLVVGNLPKNILSGPDIVKARLGNVYRQ